MFLRCESTYFHPRPGGRLGISAASLLSSLECCPGVSNDAKVLLFRPESDACLSCLGHIRDRSWLWRPPSQLFFFVIFEKRRHGTPRQGSRRCWGVSWSFTGIRNKCYEGKLIIYHHWALFRMKLAPIFHCKITVETQTHGRSVSSSPNFIYS